MKQYDYPLPQPPKLSDEVRERLKARMAELERQQHKREAAEQAIIYGNFSGT